MKERMRDCKIIDRIWLGSAEDAKERLKDSDFIVITVAWDAPVIGHHRYDLTDPGNLPGESELLAQAADKVIELLKSTDKQILVHCYSGINRSTSVVIAVLMKLQNISLLEAYNHIINIRPFAWPFPRHLEAALKYNGIDEEVDTTILPNYGGF